MQVALLYQYPMLFFYVSRLYHLIKSRKISNRYYPKKGTKYVMFTANSPEVENAVCRRRARADSVSKRDFIRQEYYIDYNKN